MNAKERFITNIAETFFRGENVADVDRQVSRLCYAAGAANGASLDSIDEQLEILLLLPEMPNAEMRMTALEHVAGCLFEGHPGLPVPKKFPTRLTICR